MKFMKKFILFILLLIVLSAVGVYTYIDVIIERAVEKYGSEALGVAVRVSSVRTGSKFDSITLHNLTIANPEGYGAEKMIRIGNIHVVADLFAVLSQPVMKISNVDINGMTINYQLNPAGEANFNAFKKRVGEEHIHQESEEKGHEKKIAISTLSITDMHVNAAINDVVQKELTLKNIIIQDIGVSQGGVTVSHAMEQIVAAVSKALAEANLANLLNQLMNLKDIKDAVNPKELLDNGVKGIGEKLDGIFGK